MSLTKKLGNLALETAFGLSLVGCNYEGTNKNNKPESVEKDTINYSIEDFGELNIQHECFYGLAGKTLKNGWVKSAEDSDYDGDGHKDLMVITDCCRRVILLKNNIPYNKKNK